MHTTLSSKGGGHDGTEAVVLGLKKVRKRPGTFVLSRRNDWQSVCPPSFTGTTRQRWLSTNRFVNSVFTLSSSSSSLFLLLLLLRYVSLIVEVNRCCLAGGTSGLMKFCSSKCRSSKVTHVLSFPRVSTESPS
ncbi:unnamed protein product, partial [Heterosigma akashiwo]